MSRNIKFQHLWVADMCMSNIYSGDWVVWLQKQVCVDTKYKLKNI